MTPVATRALARLHRWLGLGLALPLAVLALSGALLLFKSWLWVPADWRATALSQAAADDALAAMLSTDPNWLWVDVARPGRAFHTIGYADDVQAYARVGRTRTEPAPAGLAAEQALFRLHERLLAGAAGESLIRLVGPLAVVLLLAGAMLWWPRRAAWRLRHLRETGVSRPALLRFHMAWAAAVVLVLFPFLLSGALLANNPGIRAWLRQYQSAPAPVSSSAQALRFPSASMAGAISTAHRIWPDGALTQLSRPSPGAAELTLKFRLPGERHPNGRSTLTLNVDEGRLVRWYDARQGGAPAVYDDLLYAFHTGRLFGVAQAWAWLATAAALLALLVTGVSAWVLSRRRALR